MGCDNMVDWKKQLERVEKSATYRVMPKISGEYSGVIGILEKANKIFKHIPI